MMCKAGCQSLKQRPYRATRSLLVGSRSQREGVSLRKRHVCRHLRYSLTYFLPLPRYLKNIKLNTASSPRLCIQWGQRVCIPHLSLPYQVERILSFHFYTIYPSFLDIHTITMKSIRFIGSITSIITLINL